MASFPHTPPSPQPHLVHPLSDIFPDSPPLTPSSVNYPPSDHYLPSDIPRLRASHSTAGYRNGISTAKTSSLQPGFDEGYSLGAVLGLRVGYILGVLEGLCLAFGSSESSAKNAIKRGEEEGEEGGKDDNTVVPPTEVEKEKERLLTLLLAAKRELAIENVFGKEWWVEDGTWRFEVPEVDRQGVVTFFEVCDRHPLLDRWSGIISLELARSGMREKGFGVE